MHRGRATAPGDDRSMNAHAADSILFANNNPAFLMYVGILVKRLGYKVYLALDGMEALRVAKEQKPAIIMLDYQLPKVDGIPCLKMMRNDAVLRDIPIVMIGPEDDAPFRREIDKIDIQGYLKKPLNITDFYLAIQKCLNHSIKRRHVRAPLSLEVSITCTGTKTELFASNLSAEGLFLCTASPSPVGTEMDMVLTVDDEDPLELRGLVVSSHIVTSGIQQETGMGVKFLDMPQDSRYRLHYFVMQELTKDISVKHTDETWFDETLPAD